MRGRFDPGMCEGDCPKCGAGTSAPTGSPTPNHQKAGSREACSGAGKPAK